MLTIDHRPLLAACLLCLAGAPLAAALQPTSALVQEDEVEDKREVVKELIKTFEGHTKKKGKEDTEAVAVMDNLLQEFAESGPKDRVSIVKALEKSFGLKRKKNEDETPEARVATAAAICLAEMAPESVPALAKLSSGKLFKDNEALYRRVLISLGKTAHEDAVDPLLGLIDHKRPVIQGAAIEALSNFREQDQKVRKEIVNQVLKVILPIKSNSDENTEDLVARERYDITGPPAITTLQNLTDENLRDFVEWQQWWNKNKNEDWDDED